MKPCHPAVAAAIAEYRQALLMVRQGLLGNAQISRDKVRLLHRLIHVHH